MDSEVDNEDAPSASARRDQEREIALVHSLTVAEVELARDAVAVGLTLARAGIDFDARTFIALRIIEGSLDGSVDPVECLNVVHVRGMLERSVAITVGMLEETA